MPPPVESTTVRLQPYATPASLPRLDAPSTATLRATMVDAISAAGKGDSGADGGAGQGNAGAASVAQQQDVREEGSIPSVQLAVALAGHPPGESVLVPNVPGDEAKALGATPVPPGRLSSSAQAPLQASATQPAPADPQLQLLHARLQQQREALSAARARAAKEQAKLLELTPKAAAAEQSGAPLKAALDAAQAAAQQAQAQLSARQGERDAAAAAVQEAQAALDAAQQAMQAISPQARMMAHVFRQAPALTEAQLRIEAAQQQLGQAQQALTSAEQAWAQAQAAAAPLQQALHTAQAHWDPAGKALEQVRTRLRAQMQAVQQAAEAEHTARSEQQITEQLLFGRLQQVGASGHTGALDPALGQALAVVLDDKQQALIEAQAQVLRMEQALDGAQAQVQQLRGVAGAAQDHAVELDLAAAKLKGELEAAKVPQALAQLQVDERQRELEAAQAKLQQANERLAEGNADLAAAAGHQNGARRQVAYDAAHRKIEEAQGLIAAAQAQVAAAQQRLDQARAALAEPAKAVQAAQAKWQQAVASAKAAHEQADGQVQGVEQALAKEVQAHQDLAAAQAEVVQALQVRVERLGQAAAAGQAGAEVALQDMRQALNDARALIKRQEQALAAAQARSDEARSLGKPLDDKAAAAEREANRLKGEFDGKQLRRTQAEETVAAAQRDYDGVAAELKQAQAEVDRAVDGVRDANFHKDKGNRYRAQAVAAKALEQAQARLAQVQPRLEPARQALEQAKREAAPHIEAALKAQAQWQSALAVAQVYRGEASAQAQAAEQAVKSELNAQAGLQSAQMVLLQLSTVQPLGGTSGTWAELVKLREEALNEAVQSLEHREQVLQSSRASERRERDAAVPLQSQTLGLGLIAQNLLADASPAQQADEAAQGEVERAGQEVQAARAALRQHEQELFGAEERAFRADYIKKAKKKGREQAAAEEAVNKAEEAIAQAKKRLATAEDVYARAVRRAEPLHQDAQDTRLAAQGAAQGLATSAIQLQAQQGWVEQAAVRHQAADQTLAVSQALVAQARQAHAQALAGLAASTQDSGAAKLIAEQAQASQAAAVQYAQQAQAAREAAARHDAQAVKRDALAVQAAAPQILAQFLEAKTAAAAQAFDDARSQVGVLQQDFEAATKKAAEAAPVAEEARKAMIEQDQDAAVRFALERSGQLVSAESMMARARQTLTERAAQQAEAAAPVVAAQSGGVATITAMLPTLKVGAEVNPQAVRQLAEELAQEENKRIATQTATDKAAFLKAWQSQEMSRRKTLGKQLQLMDDLAQFKERDETLKAARAHSLDTAQTLKTVSRAAIDAGERVQDAVLRGQQLGQKVVAAQAQLAQATQTAALASAELAGHGAVLVQAAQAEQAAQQALGAHWQAQQQGDQQAAAALRAQAGQVQDAGLAKLLNDQATLAEARARAPQALVEHSQAAAQQAATAIDNARQSAQAWAEMAQAMSAWASGQQQTLAQVSGQMQASLQALQQLGEQSGKTLETVYSLNEWSKAVIDEHAKRDKDVRMLHERRIRQDAIDRNAKKRGFFAKIVQFVVMAAAAIITVATFGTSAPITLPMILGAAAIGAAANALAQGINVAAGFQDEFNVKSVVLTGLSSAATLGLMKYVPMGNFIGSIGKQIGISNPHLIGGVTGAAANATVQGAFTLTGLQDEFDWAQVAASGLAVASKGLISQQLQTAGFNADSYIVKFGKMAAGGVSQFGTNALFGSKLDYFTLFNDLDELMPQRGSSWAPEVLPDSLFYRGSSVTGDAGFNHNPLRPVPGAEGIDLRTQPGFHDSPLRSKGPALDLNVDTAYRPKVGLSLPLDLVMEHGRVRVDPVPTRGHGQFVAQPQDLEWSFPPPPKPGEGMLLQVSSNGPQIDVGPSADTQGTGATRVQDSASGEPRVQATPVDFQRANSALTGPLAGRYAAPGGLPVTKPGGTLPSVMVGSASLFPSVTVAPGDTLGGLAQRHGMTLPELLVANPGLDPTKINQINVGTRIMLPAPEMRATPQYQTAATAYAAVMADARRQPLPARPQSPQTQRWLSQLPKTDTSFDVVTKHLGGGKAPASFSQDGAGVGFESSGELAWVKDAAQKAELARAQAATRYGTASRSPLGNIVYMSGQQTAGSLAGLLEAGLDAAGYSEQAKAVQRFRENAQAGAASAADQARSKGWAVELDDVKTTRDLAQWVGVQTLLNVPTLAVAGGAGLAVRGAAASGLLGRLTAQLPWLTASRAAAGTTFAALYPFHVAENLDVQRQLGNGKTHLPAAMLTAVPQTGLDLLGGAEMLLSKVGSGMAGKGLGVFATGYHTARGEALTEIGQGALGFAVGGHMVDDGFSLFKGGQIANGITPEFATALRDSGVAGFGVGGAIGGGSAAAGKAFQLASQAAEAFTLPKTASMLDSTTGFSVGPAQFSTKPMSFAWADGVGATNPWSTGLAGTAANPWVVDVNVGRQGLADTSLPLLPRPTDGAAPPPSATILSFTPPAKPVKPSGNQHDLGWQQLNSAEIVGEASRASGLLSDRDILLDPLQLGMQGDIGFDGTMSIADRVATVRLESFTNFNDDPIDWGRFTDTLTTLAMHHGANRLSIETPSGVSGEEWTRATSVLLDGGAPAEGRIRSSGPGANLEIPLPNAAGQWPAGVHSIFERSGMRTISADQSTRAPVLPIGVAAGGEIHPRRTNSLGEYATVEQLLNAPDGTVPGYEGVEIDHLPSDEQLLALSATFGDVEIAVTEIDGALRLTSGTRNAVNVLPTFEFATGAPLVHVQLERREPSMQDLQAALYFHLKNLQTRPGARIPIVRVVSADADRRPVSHEFGPHRPLTDHEVHTADSLGFSAAPSLNVMIRHLGGNEYVARLTGLDEVSDVSALTRRVSEIVRSKGGTAVRFEADLTGASEAARDGVVRRLGLSKETYYQFNTGWYESLEQREPLRTWTEATDRPGESLIREATPPWAIGKAVPFDGLMRQPRGDGVRDGGADARPLPLPAAGLSDAARKLAADIAVIPDGDAVRLLLPAHGQQPALPMRLTGDGLLIFESLDRLQQSVGESDRFDILDAIAKVANDLGKSVSGARLTFPLRDPGARNGLASHLVGWVALTIKLELERGNDAMARTHAKGRVENFVDYFLDRWQRLNEIAEIDLQGNQLTVTYAWRPQDGGGSRSLSARSEAALDALVAFSQLEAEQARARETRERQREGHVAITIEGAGQGPVRPLTPVDGRGTDSLSSVNEELPSSGLLTVPMPGGFAIIDSNDPTASAELLIEGDATFVQRFMRDGAPGDTGRWLADGLAAGGVSVGKLLVFPNVDDDAATFERLRDVANGLLSRAGRAGKDHQFLPAGKGAAFTVNVVSLGDTPGQPARVKGARGEEVASPPLPLPPAGLSDAAVQPATAQGEPAASPLPGGMVITDANEPSAFAEVMLEGDSTIIKAFQKSGSAQDVGQWLAEGLTAAQVPLGRVLVFADVEADMAAFEYLADVADSLLSRAGFAGRGHQFVEVGGGTAFEVHVVPLGGTPTNPVRLEAHRQGDTPASPAKSREGMPGRDGLPIDARIIPFSGLWDLTEQTGDEFLLAKKDSGKWHVYSGDAHSVTAGHAGEHTPGADIDFIGHTHPAGAWLSLERGPSPNDEMVSSAANAERQRANRPERIERIIFGREHFYFYGKKNLPRNARAVNYLNHARDLFTSYINRAPYEHTGTGLRLAGTREGDIAARILNGVTAVRVTDMSEITDVSAFMDAVSGLSPQSHTIRIEVPLTGRNEELIGRLDDVAKAGSSTLESFYAFGSGEFDLRGEMRVITLPTGVAGFRAGELLADPKARPARLVLQPVINEIFGVPDFAFSNALLDSYRRAYLEWKAGDDPDRLQALLDEAQEVGWGRHVPTDAAGERAEPLPTAKDDTALKDAMRLSRDFDVSSHAGVTRLSLGRLDVTVDQGVLSYDTRLLPSYTSPKGVADALAILLNQQGVPVDTVRLTFDAGSSDQPSSFARLVRSGIFPYMIAHDGREGGVKGTLNAVGAYSEHRLGVQDWNFNDVRQVSISGNAITLELGRKRPRDAEADGPRDSALSTESIENLEVLREFALSDRSRLDPQAPSFGPWPAVGSRAAQVDLSGKFASMRDHDQFMYRYSPNADQEYFAIIRGGVLVEVLKRAEGDVATEGSLDDMVISLMELLRRDGVAVTELDLPWMEGDDEYGQYAQKVKSMSADQAAADILSGSIWEDYGFTVVSAADKGDGKVQVHVGREATVRSGSASGDGLLRTPKTGSTLMEEAAALARAIDVHSAGGRTVLTRAGYSGTVQQGVLAFDSRLMPADGRPDVFAGALALLVNERGIPVHTIRVTYPIGSPDDPSSFAAALKKEDTQGRIAGAERAAAREAAARFGAKFGPGVLGFDAVRSVETSADGVTVEYAAEDPRSAALRGATPAREGVVGIGRTGPLPDGVTEVPAQDLIMWHPVPKTGVPPNHLEILADQILKNGYDVSEYIDAIRLPNGDLLSNGNHRTAAMRLLSPLPGSRTIPTRIEEWYNILPEVVAQKLKVAELTMGYTNSSFQPHLTPDREAAVEAQARKWIRENLPPQSGLDNPPAGRMSSHLAPLALQALDVPVTGERPEVRIRAARDQGAFVHAHREEDEDGRGTLVVPHFDRNRDGSEGSGKGMSEMISRLRTIKPWNEGAIFAAHLNNHSVVKIVKDEITLDGMTVKLSEEQRRAVAEVLAHLQNKVGKALPEGKAPPLTLLGDGAVEQPLVTGKTWGELPGIDARLRAMNEVHEMVRIAMRELGLLSNLSNRAVDSNVGVIQDGPLRGWRVKAEGGFHNFRFHDSGEVASWFDSVLLVPPGTSDPAMFFNRVNHPAEALAIDPYGGTTPPSASTHTVVGAPRAAEVGAEQQGGSDIRAATAITPAFQPIDVARRFDAQEVARLANEIQFAADGNGSVELTYSDANGSWTLKRDPDGTVEHDFPIDNAPGQVDTHLMFEALGQVLNREGVAVHSVRWEIPYAADEGSLWDNYRRQKNALLQLRTNTPTVEQAQFLAARTVLKDRHPATEAWRFDLAGFEEGDDRLVLDLRPEETNADGGKQQLPATAVQVPAAASAQAPAAQPWPTATLPDVTTSKLGERSFTLGDLLSPTATVRGSGERAPAIRSGQPPGFPAWPASGGGLADIWSQLGGARGAASDPMEVARVLLKALAGPPGYVRRRVLLGMLSGKGPTELAADINEEAGHIVTNPQRVQDHMVFLSRRLGGSRSGLAAYLDGVSEGQSALELARTLVNDFDGWRIRAFAAPSRSEQDVGRIEAAILRLAPSRRARLIQYLSGQSIPEIVRADPTQTLWSTHAELRALARQLGGRNPVDLPAVLHGVRAPDETALQLVERLEAAPDPVEIARVLLKALAGPRGYVRRRVLLGMLSGTAPAKLAADINAEAGRVVTNWKRVQDHMVFLTRQLGGSRSGLTAYLDRVSEGQSALELARTLVNDFDGWRIRAFGVPSRSEQDVGRIEAAILRLAPSRRARLIQYLSGRPIPEIVRADPSQHLWSVHSELRKLARRLGGQNPVDLPAVLYGVRAPDETALQLVERLDQQASAAPLNPFEDERVVSWSQQDPDRREIIRLAADGYGLGEIRQRTGLGEKAVSRVLAGARRIALTPMDEMETLVARVDPLLIAQMSNDAGAARRIAEGYLALSDTELMVLKAQLRGDSDRRIAKKLGIGEGTAKDYGWHLLKKLGITPAEFSAYRTRGGRELIIADANLARPSLLDARKRETSVLHERAAAAGEPDAGVEPAAWSYPLVIDGRPSGTYSTAQELAYDEIARVAGKDEFLVLSFDRERGRVLEPLRGDRYVLTIRDRSQVLNALSWLDPDRAARYFSSAGEFNFGPGAINKGHIPDFISHGTYDHGQVVSESNVFVNSRFLPRPDAKKVPWFMSDDMDLNYLVRNGRGRVFELKEEGGKYVLIDEEGGKRLADGYWPIIQNDGRMFVARSHMDAHPTAALRATAGPLTINRLAIDVPASGQFKDGELVYWTPDSGGYRPTDEMVEAFKLPREAFRPFPDSTDAIFGTGRGRYAMATPTRGTGWTAEAAATAHDTAASARPRNFIPEHPVTHGVTGNDGAYYPPRSPELPAWMPLDQLVEAARKGLEPGHNGVAIPDQVKRMSAVAEIGRALGKEAALTHLTAKAPDGQIVRQWRIHTGNRNGVYIRPPFEGTIEHVLVGHLHLESDKPSGDDKALRRAEAIQAQANGNPRIRPARVLYERNGRLENRFYGPDWPLTPVEAHRLSQPFSAPIEYRQEGTVAVVRVSASGGLKIMPAIAEARELARSKGAELVRFEIDTTSTTDATRDAVLNELRQHHQPHKEVAYNFRTGEDLSYWMYTVELPAPVTVSGS